MAVLEQEKDWIVVTGDLSKKSPQMREAWLSCGLTVFFLAKGWTNHSPWEQAWWLVRWWELIFTTASRTEPGIGFEVPAKSTGKLTIIPKRPKKKS